MIIVKLAGGLGNQLFQYAAGRALAHSQGKTLLLDISNYDRDHLGRQYRLNHFHIQAEFATPRDVRRISRQNRRDLFSRVWQRAERYLPRHWRSVFVDRVEGYDPALFRIRRNVALQGYWQSEKYFRSIAPLLRQELVLHTPPVGRNATLAREITGVESVSVHVRRSDYVTNNSHIVLPKTYYEAALAHLAHVAPEAYYYIFSDDIPWCRKHLDLPGPAVFVDHNGPEADFEDLRLMNLCKHHIIANSSFSWWGAWLGNNPQKIVISPRKWFSDSHRKTHDLVPETWLKT